MKNMLIGGIIGLLFMAGGFYEGMKLNPPLKPAPAPVAEVKPVDPILPPKDPISVDDLRKTSESMMALNGALKSREDAVNDREAKLRAKEDEFAAERSALDASHGKFKALFAEFQQRLDLVEANQLDQLHKQSDLYISMGDQAVDLLRPMSDAEVTRLFSVMDVKPLSKLVGTWKTKYPADAERLMKSLNDMAKVIPKEKIALSDPSIGSTAPASLTPASDMAPAVTPVPDASPAPVAIPVTTTEVALQAPVAAASPDATDSNTPPSLAPPADPSPTQIPASKMPPDSSLPNAPRPAAASSNGVNPSTPTTSDITTPGATAATPIADPNETLPVNPVALPIDTAPKTTRAPRALPVTLDTAAAQ